MNMPEMDGRETAIWLQENFPEIRVLMLTMYDSELALIRLLQSGVKGFMKKDIHPTELLHAIQSVMDNGYYYSAHTSSKLAGLFRERLDKSGPLQKILLEEEEVKFLRLVCSELTYKEIASEMGMNPRSIDGMRDMLFNRLDVKSRMGLAMYAIQTWPGYLLNLFDQFIAHGIDYQAGNGLCTHFCFHGLPDSFNRART